MKYYIINFLSIALFCAGFYTLCCFGTKCSEAYHKKYIETTKYDPILASIEISRRGYEFYNQYISKVKEIKKNIIQPKIDQFRHFYVKSLEEFNLEDN